MALAVIGSLIHVVWFFEKWGYLPQPFVYDTNDTFMDWFNTAYWANHTGAYDVWESVYPPLSFAFLKLFSLNACYESSPFWARECDLIGRTAICAFYVLDVVLAYQCFRRADPGTAIRRTIALGLGFPLLFCLERGNLILPCFAFFILAYGRLLQSARLKWLAVALTINFKPYLLLVTAPFLLKRRWRMLEGCAFATLMVFFLTFAVVGDGSPFELIKNTREWATTRGHDYWSDFYNSTSYATMVAFLKAQLPVMRFLGSGAFTLAATLPPLFIRCGQLATVACFATVAFKPGAVSTQRLAAISLATVLSTVNPGGYTEVFLVFLVLFEPWKGPIRITAITAAYLLCISFDVIIMQTRHDATTSWLGGRQVYSTFGLAIGELIRPALILIIQYALIVATFVDVRRAWLQAPPPTYEAMSAPIERLRAS